MKRRLVAAALALALFASATAHAVPFRTVALSGQPAPETPAGILFDEFTHAVINQSGEVAFNAIVAGPGVTATPTGGSTGIWAMHAGGTRKVIRSGDQAPDAPTSVLMGAPRRARIDDHGRVAFLSNSAPNFTNRLFSEGLGVLRGINPPTISTSPVFSGGGHLAARAYLQVSGPFGGLVQGIWTDVAGTMVNVIQDGDPVPGLDGFTVNTVMSPVINDHGVVAFATLIDGPGVRLRSVIWTYEGGVLSRLPEPGAGPRINNAGQILFSTSSGFFRYSAGVTEPVATVDAQAPGAELGVLLTNPRAFRINGAGDASFFGTLTGPGVIAATSIALWTERNGNLEMVARTGTQAPGAPVGVNFGSFQTFTDPDLAVNSAGQLAFAAGLSGAGVDASNNSGIWATDLTGTLRMIVREGDLFDVDDDPSITDLRTIRTAAIAIVGGNGEDGSHTSFNDAGELVATLNFTDGSSGVFVFATAVPEPGALALAGLGIVAGLSFARRKCPA